MMAARVAVLDRQAFATPKLRPAAAAVAKLPPEWPRLPSLGSKRIRACIAVLAHRGERSGPRRADADTSGSESFAPGSRLSEPLIEGSERGDAVNPRSPEGGVLLVQLNPWSRRVRVSALLLETAFERTGGNEEQARGQ